MNYSLKLQVNEIKIKLLSDINILNEISRLTKMKQNKKYKYN